MGELNASGSAHRARIAYRGGASENRNAAVNIFSTSTERQIIAQ
jgi:hypothetical protein